MVKFILGLLLALTISQIEAGVVSSNEIEKKSALNVAVIGAGTAGLVSAKYSVAAGYNVTVYEQNDQIGGVWWYTDKTGKDEYGLDTHSAMYQGLRTNLPYQVMEFNGHHYPNETKGYPPQPEVTKYLHSYADRFELKKIIKFRHSVIRVLPIEDGKWEVIVKDLPNNKFETIIYDAVFVCNGHFAKPKYPDLRGKNDFQGKSLHSHDFRTAEAFRGESVLVIGAGASGMDMVMHLSKTAERVTFSQHKRPHETPEQREKRKSLLPPKVQLQDNVKRITADGADFIDGTHETFTVILYATGYYYTYPFLSVDSGINVDDNFVKPLYKQIINIENPTMVFIGIPYTAATTQAYDLQTRFAIKFLSGEKKLPCKQEMMTDMLANCAVQWNKGYPKRHTHYLGPEQREYYNQLSQTAEIENVPDVICSMHFDSRATMTKAPSQFRKYKYTVIDDKTFVKEKMEE